jgi:hypothetical protein
MNQPDALRLLLDRILGGADVTLVNEGDGGHVLLALAADCLAGLRSRVLRAAEVLPGTLGAAMPAPHVAEPSKASVPDDELLTRSFQALTVLDQTCDRIVLLVGDAHALQHSALRYIQFASRSGPHLQLVFCGTRKFFDLLNVEEFAWLRARLMAGLVVTLAAPIAETSDASPGLPFAPDGPAAWSGETDAPLPGAQRPAVSASMPSRILWLGALALLGLGGAACLTLSMQNGKAGGPAASRQAAAVIQPPMPPEPPAASVAGAQVLGDIASRADSEARPAAPDTQAPHPPVTASDVQDAGPGSPSSMPPAPSTTAPSASITVWSQTKAGTSEAEPNERRLPEPLPDPARSLGRQNVPAVSSRSAAAAAASRARRFKEARDQSAPLPAGDRWLAPQPAFGSWEPPSGRSPRYIGSYATDANGVRTFHLEP